MCKYCETNTQIPNEALNIYIKNKKLNLIYDIGDAWDNVDTYIDIKYCPFCGRKLK